jgi:Bifunctional DNA primase/polymerase, N-terminal
MDPDQIKAWWIRWPNATIGARVPESLLVIDVDPRNGGSLAELESLTGPLPATLTAWSGRDDGGRHLYFRRPLAR